MGFPQDESLHASSLAWHLEAPFFLFPLLLYIIYCIGLLKPYFLGKLLGFFEIDRDILIQLT